MVTIKYLPFTCAAITLAVHALVPASAETWEQVRGADIAEGPPGWSAPVRLAVNTRNWEDSMFVSPDGSAIYFAYYPGENLLGDLMRRKFKGDIDNYYSAAPFTTKQKIMRFHLSDPVVSANGIMIDDHGDWWYHSNYEGLVTKKFDDDLYRNAERLPFNDDRSFTNPHYCAVRDELWFEIGPDKGIVVMRNAVSSGFSSPVEFAPAPINSPNPGVHDSVPWLNRDGTTMYFVSDRDHRGLGGWIYRTQRDTQGRWSKPQVILRSKIGVGEPTLTANGRRLFFAQVFRKKNGDFTSDLFYIERGGAIGMTATSSAPRTLIAAAPARNPGKKITGLVGLGSTHSFEPRGGRLIWRYTRSTSPLPVFTTSAGLGVEAGHRGISLRMKSDRTTHLALVLDETGGGRYEHRFVLAVGDWVELDLPWKDFSLQKGSSDPDGRLDPLQIKQMTVVDISGFLGMGGDNRVEIERLELRVPE